MFVWLHFYLNRVFSLSHTEDTKYYDAPAGKFLLITNPRGLSPWTVIYTRQGGTNDVPVVDESTFSRAYFDGRLEVMFDGIMIDSVESRDAGTFKFKDSDGNLAQIAYLKVHSGEQLNTLFL